MKNYVMVFVHRNKGENIEEMEETTKKALYEKGLKVAEILPVSLARTTYYPPSSKE